MNERKVIIRVEGGVVTNVYSNVHDIDAVVVDYDCEDDWNDEQREADGIIESIWEQRENGNIVTDFIELDVY